MTGQLLARVDRSIAAGVVLYHPERAHLVRMVARLATEVERIMLFANTPVAHDFEAEVRAVAGGTAVELLNDGSNVGLGTAYNAFMASARARSIPLVLLFDQDSLPQEGMARRLAALHEALSERGERPAIVGPQPIDPHGQPMRIAPDRRRMPHPDLAATPAAFVISSGSLLSVAAAGEVGAFREDYFIDAIDIEWCFRAWARGRSVWIGSDVRMDHRLGSGVIRLPLGVLLTDQPARRIYTYFRNQLSMMRLPHVPMAYKARIVGSMPLRIAIYLLRSRFSRETRNAVVAGLVDGIRNRLGRPTL